jgi:hypothetical protein
VLVLDAHDTVSEQDASVLGIALQRGRALIIAINKWDGIPAEQREEIQRQLSLKLDFVPFAPLQFISARHGTGVGELMQLTVRAYEAAMREMPTRELTRTLEKAMTVHQPPMIRGRRIKMRTRVAETRRASSFMVTRRPSCLMRTAATWRTCFARSLICSRPRSPWNSGPTPTPTTGIPATSRTRARPATSRLAAERAGEATGPARIRPGRRPGSG